MVSRPCTVAMKVLQIYGCRRDGRTWHSFMDRVYLHVITFFPKNITNGREAVHISLLCVNMQGVLLMKDVVRARAGIHIFLSDSI